MIELNEMTREEAQELYDSEFWAELTPKQRGHYQLFTVRLVMPFDLFHEGVEALLKRAVYTHEFAFADQLREEYLSNTRQKMPTLDQAMNKGKLVDDYLKWGRQGYKVHRYDD